MEGEERIIILHSEDGDLTQVDEVKGNVYDVVKKVVAKALEKWEPRFSDFVVVKDEYEVSLKLPLTPEQYKKYYKYGLQKTSDGHAVFKIPVFMVSYENQWMGGDYKDRRVYVVTIYVDEDVMREVKEWAAQATSEQQGETPSLDEIEV